MHPNSRKALQQTRNNARKEKIKKTKRTFRKEKVEPEIDRLTWIQLYIPVYTEEKNRSIDRIEDLREILRRYVNRNAEEIAEKENLPKEASSRLRALKQTRELERKEFLSGISVPDITDKNTFARFLKWDGDYNAIRSFKAIRVSSSK
ncbi:MAG: uncharacterized protein A8A55_0134 [Amphiamblys sp. WSBS2006]|nr:MAG: uncharacterized protein A8A55_0134 [Amphiamblys sp. WSBS2006]